jgi:hypothetical protein
MVVGLNPTYFDQWVIGLDPHINHMDVRIDPTHLDYLVDVLNPTHLNHLVIGLDPKLTQPPGRWSLVWILN